MFSFFRVFRFFFFTFHFSSVGPSPAPLSLKHRLFLQKSHFQGKILGERRRKKNEERRKKKEERRKKKEERRKKEEGRRKKNAPTETGHLPQSHAQELFLIREHGNPSLRWCDSRLCSVLLHCCSWGKQQHLTPMSVGRGLDTK